MANTIRQNEINNTSHRLTKSITIALAGNPNSGKTTIFNALTGARQHVGNYPGVTVEKKEGTCKHGGINLNIIDLPGTYSLTAYSIEELVARNHIIDEKPDVVIDVIDSSNIERNLYLAVQLMELNVPLVLAFNMADLAKQRGLVFDIDLLQTLLGVTIVPTVGHKGKGKHELLNAAIQVATQVATNDHEQNIDRPKINYGDIVESEIDKLELLIDGTETKLSDVPKHWVIIKLLEGDTELQKKINNSALLEAVSRSAKHIESLLGDSPEAIIADHRYGFISGACQEAIRSTTESRHNLSDQIDAVVTNRVLGLPIFLGLMYLVFYLTFTVGSPPMEWIESGFGWLGETVSGFWSSGSESLLKGLLIDGIIAGVGGVIIFLPNIILLFFAIAILEDSGYMARAAFLMDRLMHKIGLHGKSFIPMLIGFGCSIPAIMATRTLESRRDRLTTMLVIPLMSCGARLPIYALIIPAFFPKVWHTPMLWLIYIIGIVLAVISAKVLRSTLFRGDAPPFVMELPPYRMPTIRSVMLHMGQRSGLYLKKAGTIILAISIVLWALAQWPNIPDSVTSDFDQQRAAIETDTSLTEATAEEQLATIDNAQAEADLEYSLIGKIGSSIEPLLRPCGFDWKISTAMIGAFAAKEVFVSQMGIVYSLGEEEDEESPTLREKLQVNYTPLQGFCIMLFCLISAPCMATIAVTKRESNSWKWALFQLGGLTLLAWVVTTAVYQIGQLFV